MEIFVRQVPGEGRGGNHFVTEDSFTFHCYKKSIHARYFRYRKYEKIGCLARLTEKNGIFRNTVRDHNHLAENDDIARYSVVNKCVDRAEETRVRLKRVFDKLRESVLEALIGYDHALERKLQRARRSKQPPIPQSFEEAEKLIQDYPEYSETSDGSSTFFHGRVSSGTGTAFLFISLDILPQLFRAKQLHADGTFRTVPNLFYQLLTIHVMVYGKAFPIAYVLMSNKSLGLYNAVMGKILETLETNHPGNVITIELMISDFETSILWSMQIAFPNGRSRGCWFHYGQAIYRRACKEGLTVAYQTSETVKTIAKMLIAISLLPSNKAFDGFQRVKSMMANASGRR